MINNDYIKRLQYDQNISSLQLSKLVRQINFVLNYHLVDKLLKHKFYKQINETDFGDTILRPSTLNNYLSNRESLLLLDMEKVYLFMLNSAIG